MKPIDKHVEESIRSHVARHEAEQRQLKMQATPPHTETEEKKPEVWAQQPDYGQVDPRPSHNFLFEI